MGMKTISLPGKDLVFKSTPRLLVIGHWLFGEAAGYSPTALRAFEPCLP
jgi:hypothetical protein